MKRIITLMVTVCMLLMSVSAFAADMPVNVQFYKKGTYGTDKQKLSHANDAVETTKLDIKEDGSADLVIITKWFTLYGIPGTMTGIIYDLGSAEGIEKPEKDTSQELRLYLPKDLVDSINDGQIVQLQNAKVRNNVKFGLIHTSSYNEVDAIIAK